MNTGILQLREYVSDKKRMKYSWILLSYCLFWALPTHAQTIGPYEQVKLPERMVVKGVTKSNIDWENLRSEEWLSYKRWRQVLELRERPNDYGLAEPFRKKFREAIGRVLECVGVCRLYRGLPHNKVQFRSPIKEGDDLVTDNDSYLWIFLYDGTMVRLSPNSSVSLREINIGKKENFIHARINQGNVLWLSRSQRKLHKLAMKEETDKLFVPLSYYEVGVKTPEPEVDEQNLLGLLDEYDIVGRQYERANKLIEENNQWFTKPTYAFLVMQNGSVFAKNPSIEFITLNGKESYLKVRKYEQLALQGETPGDPVTFYFRGFENKRTEDLEKGAWYAIDPKGRSATIDDSGRFNVGEFITRNIPTIYVARELLMKQYSGFSQKIDDGRILAKNHGYHLWSSLENPRSDLSRRIDFLREYTRRIETTQMLVTKQIRKKMIVNDMKSRYNTYGPHFYSRAVKDLMIDRKKVFNGHNGKETLNSTKRPLWKRMHGIH
jgi:hypothetical protein